MEALVPLEERALSFSKYTLKGGYVSAQREMAAPHKQGERDLGVKLT